MEGVNLIWEAIVPTRCSTTQKCLFLLATDLRVNFWLPSGEYKYLAFAYVPAWAAAPLAADVPQKDATRTRVFIYGSRHIQTSRDKVTSLALTMLEHHIWQMAS